MGADKLHQIEDLLKQYALLANSRDKKRTEKEEREREERRQKNAQKAREYEEAKTALTSELYATTNGEYTHTLIKILNDQPHKALHLGKFTRETQGATIQTHEHNYGIRKSRPGDESQILFYVDDMHSQVNPISEHDMLALVTVRGLDDLPKLVLTAEQYKQDLTNAVSTALEKLKEAEGVQEK